MNNSKMEMIHRFGAGKDENYYKSYLQLLKEYPKAGNSIWFASFYGFPSLQKHEVEAERLNIFAEIFRENHIAVSLQISNTIGHGEYISAQDCTGLVYDGSLAENLVGADGTKARYCFCWNGKHFREYTKKAVAAYARLHPECVWFDDDLRPSNHDPVGFGCFCDNCIAAFNKKYAKNIPFTREALVNEVLYGNISVRENWVQFIRDGLYSFTKEICSAFHEVSPESEFGYQYCAYGAYTGRGFSYILDAMKEVSGKPPRTRPGGGAYDDHDPNVFIAKAVFMNWTNSLLPDYVKEKCPEIENLPFESYAKSPAGCAFESAYYFANGATDMSFSMMMHENEVREYYTEMLARLSADAAYRNRLAAENLDTISGGARIFISGDTWKRKLSKKVGEGFGSLNDEKSWVLKGWVRDGIPLTFDESENDVILLYPEMAKDLSSEDFDELLKANVFTDGESIKILAEKFGGKVYQTLGIKSQKICDGEKDKFFERNLSHATLPKDFYIWKNNFFTSGRNEVYCLNIFSEQNENAVQPLAVYDTELAIKPYVSGKYPYGISAAVVKTEADGNWALFGNAVWKGVMSFKRREQLLNVMDYLCVKSGKGGLCARLKSPKQVALLPRKDKRGKTVCVSIANLTIGDSGEMLLAIRNPRAEHFTFMKQASDEEIALQFKVAQNENGIREYLVNLPSIAAYSVCTVFID